MIRANAFGAWVLIVTASIAVQAASENQAGGRAPAGFAGFSEATTPADQGLFQLHEACQAKFGAGTRMCTTDEVSNATRIPDLPEGPAWVDSRQWGAPGTESRLRDCGGWTGNGIGTTDPVGTTVDHQGRFASAECTEVLRVACCRGEPAH